VSAAGDSLASVLRAVRRKGVHLWAEGGLLRYRAPKGSLTAAEIEILRRLKSQIVPLLERTAASEPEPERRPHADRAPLTFAQIAHWNHYRLSEHLSKRLVTDVLRVRGRLDIGVLRESLDEMADRHEALRVRIGFDDGMPEQRIGERGTCALEVEDLRHLPRSSQAAEIRRRIDRLILDPVDVSRDPLCMLRLLKVHDDDAVLALGMEHLVSDGSSLNILLRELFQACSARMHGRNRSLPSIPLQYGDHAYRQRRAEQAWIQRHEPYWTARMAGCRRVSFPAERHLEPLAPGWGNVSFQVGPELKRALREWCRSEQTTLVMGVFAAYVALVLRWCDVPDAVFQYQSNGRASEEVENTIGLFAYPLCMRLEVTHDDTFPDLLRRVRDGYCTAHEHADFGYCAAQLPRPEFFRNTIFNWTPRGGRGEARPVGSGEDLVWAPMPFDYPQSWNTDMDGEPSVLLYDSEHDIWGDVYFPLNRFTPAGMERFVRSFRQFIREMTARPGRRVSDVQLP
jgi:hypothetical protein